jgi:16S rRNA (cytosine1402-N4)-methyltransferase
MSDVRHIPVLAREVVDALQPRDGGRYLDGTFGAGGYTALMLDRADCKVIAIDRDPDAIAAGQALAGRYAPRLRLIEGRFGDMAELLSAEGVEDVDGVALDLGVSSMQLDQPDRGFSFRASGPLDIAWIWSSPPIGERADESGSLTSSGAAGEERKSRRVARHRRGAQAQAHETTASWLISCAGRLNKGSDESDPPPTFQALRIAVNDELGELGAVSPRQAGAGAGRTAGCRLVSFAGGPRGQGIRPRPRRPHARPVASRAAARRGSRRDAGRPHAQAGAAVGRRDRQKSARPLGAPARRRKAF